MTAEWRNLIGIPHAALNCYALAQATAMRFGRALPDLADEVAACIDAGDAVLLENSGATEHTTAIPSGEQPQPGDLALICESSSRAITHVAILVEPGLLLHSLRDGRSSTVRVRHIESRIHSFRRLPEC